MAYSGREREEAESERKMEGKKYRQNPASTVFSPALNPWVAVAQIRALSWGEQRVLQSARLQRPPHTPSSGASAARFSGAPRLRKQPRFMFSRHGWVHLVLKKSLIFAPPNCGMLLLAPLSFA